MSESYWTSKRATGWAVKKEGASRASSIHSTQSEAWSEARRLARGSGGEAYLKGEDGIEAVIPLREGTTGHAAHDAEKYKWRHLVENFFCAIKAFRRIATRYEKTDTCFAAMINVVAVVLWTR